LISAEGTGLCGIRRERALELGAEAYRSGAPLSRCRPATVGDGDAVERAARVQGAPRPPLPAPGRELLPGSMSDDRAWAGCELSNPLLLRDEGDASGRILIGRQEMTENMHRPISFPADRGGFLDWATSEDDGCLSVAGLATRCGLVRAPEAAEQERP